MTTHMRHHARSGQGRCCIAPLDISRCIGLQPLLTHRQRAKYNCQPTLASIIEPMPSSSALRPYPRDAHGTAFSSPCPIRTVSLCTFHASTNVVSIWNSQMRIHKIDKQTKRSPTPSSPQTYPDRTYPTSAVQIEHHTSPPRRHKPQL